MNAPVSEPRPRIATPGIYDIPATTYHDTICTPAPALSAGMAGKIMDACPARAWFDSPLNPNFEPTQKPEFDIGRAAHLLFLEPDQFDAGVVLIDAADYRTNAAKEARAAAYLDNLVPLLPHQAAMIHDMRRALRNELADLPFETACQFTDQGLRGGKAEQSYFWRDERHGIWCKARPDYVLPGILIDYKTSATANPDEIQRPAANLGWHRRAAWYIDGHKALTGEKARYWYIVQEKEPPHFAEVFTLETEFIDIGRIENAKAAEIWADCLQTGHWPRYRNTSAPSGQGAHLISMPPWLGSRFDAREARGDYTPKPSRELLAAGIRAQAPAGQR